MQELLKERGYNRKVFDLGNGQKKYRFHTAHKHYKGSAIEGFEFKDIDTTLSWDAKNSVWHQDKASYHSDIPEYADGIFNFHNLYDGADHFIKARPVADHVRGELFNGQEDGNFVLYRDAFGKGIDLKVYAYHAGLKKVIIVNEKPEKIDDLIFKFELLELQDLSFRTKEDAAISVSASTVNYDFKDATIKIGKDGKYSYFRNALMWDSNGYTLPVNISIEVVDGKTFIVKTIPRDFINFSVYPIYTDHPTSYYAGEGDGYCTISAGGYISYQNTWDVAHGWTSSSPVAGANYAGTTCLCRSVSEVYSTNYWRVRFGRCFFPTDTSGIDDGATISAAVLNLYCTALSNGDNDGDDWINVVQTSQASTASLVADDCDQCGAISNPTEGATRIDIGSLTTSAYNGFTLNATGIGWIDKTGYTKLGIREGHDAINSPTAFPSTNSTTWATSEDTSGTKDPYLEVTTGASGATAIMTTNKGWW